MKNDRIPFTKPNGTVILINDNPDTVAEAESLGWVPGNDAPAPAPAALTQPDGEDSDPEPGAEPNEPEPEPAAPEKPRRVSRAAPRPVVE
jgi:hypothetical protein